MYAVKFLFDSNHLLIRLVQNWGVWIIQFFNVIERKNQQRILLQVVQQKRDIIIRQLIYDLSLPNLLSPYFKKLVESSLLFQRLHIILDQCIHVRLFDVHVYMYTEYKIQVKFRWLTCLSDHPGLQVGFLTISCDQM